MTSKNMQEHSHDSVPITSEGVVINSPGYGKVEFLDGAITYYRKSKRWIKFQTYLKGTEYTPTARVIDANTITYQGGKWIQAKYEFYNDGVKETITLKDLPQAQRVKLSDLSFYITSSEGTHVVQQPSGDLWLMRTASGDITERCLMVVPAPTAVDSASTAFPISWSYNDTTKFLTITGSLTGAVYPVNIDPSVNLDTAADDNATKGNRCIARDSSGRIWLAWFDDLDVEIGYSDDNGGSFTTEEPFTSKASCIDLGIAVDSSRNVHLAFTYIPSNRDTLYMKRTHSTSTWSSTTTIETGTTYSNMCTTVLVDSSDNIFVCWYRSGPDTGKGVALKKYTGSWGSVQTTDTGNNSECAFALDSSGTVHAIYGDKSTTPDSIKHIEYTTSWGTPESVATDASYDLSLPSIAIDSSGNLHVAWRRGVTPYIVYYKKKTGASWGSEESTGLETSGSYINDTISLTQAGVPIVGTTGHGTGTYDFITSQRNADGSWATAYSFLNFNAVYFTNLMWAYYPACATVAQGCVPIGGMIGACTSYTGSKYYATFAQSNDFQPLNRCQEVYSVGLNSNVGTEVDFGGSGGYITDRNIARSSSGRFWIAFNKTLTTIVASYSDDGGKTWNETTILSGSGNTAGVSIAVDSNGDLHAAYSRYVGSYYETKYKKYSGGSWGTEEDVTSSSTVDNLQPIIAVDSSNYPHVVYRYSVYIIKYRYKTSGGWQTAETVVNGGSNTVVAPSFVIDSSNDKHVTYAITNSTIYDIKYIKKTGSSWGSAETVKASAMSTSYTPTVSIALHSTQYPYVHITGNAVILVSRGTGSWVECGTGLSGQTGGGICIDQDDKVYSLTQSGETYLSLRIWSGSSWGSQVVLTGRSSSDGLFRGISPIWAYSSDKRSIPDTGAMCVYIADTISTSYSDVYVWKSSDLTWGGGGTLNYKSVTGTMTAARSLTRLPRKRISGSEVGTGSVRRRVGKRVTKTEVAVGAIRKKVTKTALTKAMVGVVSLLKTKISFKTLTAVETAARSLTKRAGKRIVGTETGSGSLSKLSKFKKTLTSAETAVRSLIKRAKKNVTGTEVSSGSVRKRALKRVVGSVTGVGSILYKKVIGKIISGTETAVGTLRRRVGKRVVGTETGSGSLTKISRFKKTLTAAETAVGTLRKRVLKGLSQVVTGVVSLSKVGKQTFTKTLTAAMSGATSLRRRVGKMVTGTETAQRDLRRRVGKRVSVSEVGSATLSRISKFKKSLTATGTSIGTLRRRIGKILKPSQNLLPRNTADGTDSLQNITGFTASGATVTSSPEQKWQGLRSLKIVTPGSAGYEGAILDNFSNISVGQTYTISCYLRGTVGNEFISLRFRDSLGGETNQSNTIATDWSSRWTVTRTIPAGVTYVWFEVVTGSSQATTFYVDGFQFEQGNSATVWSMPDVTGNAVLSRRTKKFVSGVVSAVGSVRRKIFKTLSQVVAGIVSLGKSTAGKFYKTLTFTMVGSVSLTRKLSLSKTLTAVETGVGSVIKRITKKITGTETAVGTLRRKFFKTLRVPASLIDPSFESWINASTPTFWAVTGTVARGTSHHGTGSYSINYAVGGSEPQNATSSQDVNLSGVKIISFWWGTTWVFNPTNFSFSLEIDGTPRWTTTDYNDPVWNLAEVDISSYGYTGVHTISFHAHNEDPGGVGEYVTFDDISFFGGMTASLLYKKFIGKVITATMSGVTSLRRRTGKIVTAIENGIGSLSRLSKFKKTLTATETAARTLIKRVGKRIVGTETGVGTLRKRARKILTGVEVAAGILRKRVLKRLSGTETAVGSLLKKLSFKKILTATETAIGSVRRRITKKITGTMIGVATLLYSTAAKWYKTLSTTAVGTTSTIKRKVGKFISGSEVAVGSIRKRITKKITVVESSIAILGKGWFKRLTAIEVSSASLRKRAGKILTTSEIVVGSLRRRVGKVVSGIEQAVGSIRRRITKTISQAVQAIGLLYEGGYVKKYYQTLSTVAQVNPILRAGKRFLKTLSTTVSAVVRLWHDYFAGGYTEQRACVLLTCDFNPLQNVTCNFDPYTNMDCDFDTPPAVYLQCSLKCVR